MNLSIRKIGFIIFFVLVSLSACREAEPVALEEPTSPVKTEPPESSEETPLMETEPPASSGTDLSVEVEWTYHDEERLGVEIAVTNYPLPEGYQLGCPFTQIDLVIDLEETRLLYLNETQIDLDEYYALVPQSRWLCQQQGESAGTADYHLSLTHTYAPEAALDWDETPQLNVTLGEITAYSEMEEIILPSQGTFEFPLALETAGIPLTWSPETKLTGETLDVEINRVTINRSLATLDVCVIMEDQHSWQPQAALLVGDQEMEAREYLLTVPLNAPDRDTVLNSTRRCFSFLFPSDSPMDALEDFQIGVTEVVIDNANPGVVTMAECEAVKNQVEADHPGLEIRCYEFETRGQSQIWFEVLAHPEEISDSEAYTLVESAFKQTLLGPWLVDLQRTIAE